MLLAKDIITEAYRLIGVVAEDEEPTAAQMARGLRTFGAMVKSFQVDQSMDWLSTDGWMTLTPGKWVYFMGGHHLNMGFDFPNRPLEMYDIHVTDASGIDLPVELLSAEDYHEIPDKVTRGLPLRAHLDGQLGQSRLYLWQVPDRQYVLKFRYQREIAIPKTENEYIEFPDEWQEMLEYNLAVRLAAKNGVQATEYQDVYQMAMKLDKEMKDRALQGGEFVVRPDPGRWW